MVGGAGQHQCRGPGGPGGQQGDHEPLSGRQQPGLHIEQNHQQDKGCDPSVLSLSSIEGMAGMWGLSSMFSSTTETWTF